MTGGLGRSTAARGEELFDDTVFQGMERDHGEASARPEDSLGGMERLDEFAQFVVHGDAQPLERPGGRMDSAGGIRPDHARHDLGERRRGLDRAFPPGLDDGAGHRPRAALLAVMVDDVGQRRLLGAIDKVGGALAGALHAHVQGPIVAEREAAVGLVDLHRGDADIEDDGVGRFDALFPDKRIKRAEPAGHEGQTPFGSCHEAGATCDGSGIAVDREHADPWIGMQHRAGVAACTEGSVDNKGCARKCERCHHFGD